MNLGHNCLFQKGVCNVYFGDKRENSVTVPHSSYMKHDLLVKIKEKAKSNKVAPRNKVVLVFLHHRLGHRPTTSLMAEYTANVWQDIKIGIDTDPFCISCQISSINKKARSKNPLKPKVPLKWVLWTLFQQHPQNV